MQDLAAHQLRQLQPFCTLLHTRVKATPFLYVSHRTLCHLGEPRPSAPEGRRSALESPAFPHHDNSLPWFHSYFPQIINRRRQCVSEKWSELGINTRTITVSGRRSFGSVVLHLASAMDAFLTAGQNLEGRIRVVSSEVEETSRWGGSDKAAWWF